MKKIKCNKVGCKGDVDMDNLKFISPIKMSGKCKKCGKNNFLARSPKTPFNIEQRKKKAEIDKENNKSDVEK